MPKKTPTVGVWMPLYITDYLGDTMHLTTEQHGAYLLLLMACWKADGRVPGDPLALQTITRMSAQQWAKNQPVLERFFLASEGYWTHKRVLEELSKAKGNVVKRSAAGRRGAAARWGIEEGGRVD